MRSTTEVVREETSPEGEQSLVLQHLHEAVQQVLVGHLVGHRVGTHVHQTGLHQIERQRSERTAETGHGGGEQVRRQTLADVVHDELLREIVRSQHSEVHRHRTEDHGQTSTPQGHQSLLLRDTVQGREAVAVTTSLLHREKTISLHTHHRNIEGVTNDTSQSSRGQRGGSGHPEGKSAIVALLQFVGENTVETQTSCSVNSLSHQRSRQTGIQLHHSLVLNQVLSDGDGTNVLGLPNDLNTGLNQIDRLHLHPQTHA